MVFALFVSREGNLSGQSTSATRYFHPDHLGSIAAISDEAGALVERLAYDPWGKRRSPTGQPDNQDALVGWSTERGFTMHEHLDEVGVVHMNGRIYDPLIGRFMSADPFIQDPWSLWSHNRYSYVGNNPLGYTDPSGYFSLRKSVGAFLKFSVNPTIRNTFNMFHALPGQQALDRYVMTHQWAYAVGQIAATVFGLGAPGAALYAAYYGYQATGSVGAGLQAGAVTYATAYAFSLVGAHAGPTGSFGNYAGHAVVGCASAVASGGNCGAGAASALFGKFATAQGPDWLQRPVTDGQLAAGVAYTAIAGGVGSVIAGGKFENGAVTAAFGYLFNALQEVRLRGMGTTYLDDQFALRVERWTELARARGVELTFNEAFRTTAYQADLTGNPNAITPASAGSSLHEAGFAVDVNYSSLRNVPGGLTGNEQRQIIRDTAAQAGLTWGGTFRRPDPPHFYYDPGGRAQSIIDAQRDYCRMSRRC